MVSHKAVVKAPNGYSWMSFLKTYRSKNKANYPRTRNGNKRLMQNAGKAWKLFKEQSAAAFTDIHYGESSEEEVEMEDVSEEEVDKTADKPADKAVVKKVTKKVVKC